MSIKRLYKYCRFNKNTKSIIRDSSLYASSPLKFNDPFDCHLPMSFKASKNIRERKFKHLAQKHSISVDQMMHQIDKLNREGYFDRLEDYRGMELLKRMQKDWGVICLSERNDDLLMWAHYGNMHKGVCLQFDVAPASIFEHAKRVKYSGTYPFLNWFRHSDDELRDRSLLVKSRHWVYEKEWRINFTKIGLYQFPQGALMGVIFGCRASKKTKSEVNKLLATRKPPVDLFQCVVSKTRFELSIERLK